MFFCFEDVEVFSLTQIDDDDDDDDDNHDDDDDDDDDDMCMCI